MAELKGKVVIVTGAASGIGRSTALEFGKEGAKVVVADIQAEESANTVQMIKNKGGEALFVKCDVSKVDDIQNLVKQTIAAYGKLDCAVNSAGIGGMGESLQELSENAWERVNDINLKGVFLCCKYEIEEMLKGGGGAIVNIASGAALRYAIPSNFAYPASKAGVMTFSKQLAFAFIKQNIRVNSVLPGMIRTPILGGMENSEEFVKGFVAPLQPIGRLGEPEEVANAAVWLCSEKASFVTGVALPVDGGWSI